MKALTTRELQILELIALGYKIDEIACSLFIAESTVVTHRCKLLKKLHAKNSCNMIYKATKNKIIP